MKSSANKSFFHEMSENILINSFPPNAAYMRRSTGLSLV